MKGINYRQLNAEDLEGYKRVRLQLLKEEDGSFGSSYEEESLFDQAIWVKRLSKTSNITYGAFDKDGLIGLVMAVLNPRRKMKHVATLNSLYVASDKRKLGLARKLVQTLIQSLKLKEIECIKLSVVTTNKPAIHLYESLGFSIYGTETGFIKVGEKYIDQYLLRLDILE